MIARGSEMNGSVCNYFTMYVTTMYITLTLICEKIVQTTIQMLSNACLIVNKAIFPFIVRYT